MSVKGISLAAAVLIPMGAASVYFTQDKQEDAVLLANERAVQEAFVKGDSATYAKYVAPDGLGIDGMGRTTVPEVLKMWTEMTKALKITEWDITDVKTTWIDSDIAILTYKWTGKGTYHDKPIPSTAWASTVWSKKKDKWIAVFHQETLPMEMPAEMKKQVKK